MEDRLTLVTGFFDCGRGTHTYQKRTPEEYLKYFEFWAGMQNPVILFGDAQITQAAYAIRKKRGRAAQTRVVVIEDPIACAPEVYAAMERVEKQGDYKNWRERPNDISNEARYDYVLFMKFWMMRYAAEHWPESGTLVWMDLGFNHGGACYVKPEEFDFLWKHSFSPDKVHLFALKDMEEERGYLKLMCMTDSVMGCPIASSTGKAAMLYEKIRECVLVLAALDLLDDDQMWLTMACKRWPEDFALHRSDWFMPIKENGGEHLTVKRTAASGRVTDVIKRRGVLGAMRAAYIKAVHHMSAERYDYWKRLKTVLGNYS
jgi:protein YibB